MPIQPQKEAHPMTRSAWIFAAVLAALPCVAQADDAQPDSGAPAVCKPHADPKPGQKALAQARDIARSITAEYLEGSQYAMPDQMPGMLRQLATMVECDEQEMTHWPTMQECQAMPTPICTARLEDCRRAANERLACFDKVRAGDPKATSDRLASEARAEAKRIEPLIAAEVACRASAKCMAERALKVTIAALCNADYWLEDNERVIREEKANVSGVVDLSVLHDAGDAIRIHTAQIAALKPALHRGWRGWRVECADSHGMFHPAMENLLLPGAQ